MELLAIFIYPVIIFALLCACIFGFEFLWNMYRRILELENQVERLWKREQNLHERAQLLRKALQDVNKALRILDNRTSPQAARDSHGRFAGKAGRK